MSRFLAKRLGAIEPYTPGEQPQGMTFIKLNTNESPYPPAPAVLQALNGEEAAKLRLYSDPDLRELTAALAKYHGVSEKQIFCGNGSDEVLTFAFQAWGTDDGVAYPDISYGFYPVFAQYYGLDAKVIPLEEDLSIDPAKYEGLGRMVVFANPNAPTGLTMPVEAIRKIAKSDPDHVVLVDEAYVDFGGESALSLLEECENLIVVRTFSKSRQMAGARLGYAVAGEALIADLNRLKFSFNPYNVNRLTSLAGRLSVEDEDWFQSCCRKVMATRAVTTEGLREMGFTVLESRANFIFAKSPAVGGEEYYKKLREKGILVRHFKNPRIGDFVRITIGSDEEMQTLLEKTKEILKEAEG